MGRKKKFIDKKNSATFQLLARDSSDPNYSPDSPSGDRVFIRVDNNTSYNHEAFASDHQEEPGPAFADAPEDASDANSSYSFGFGAGEFGSGSGSGPLPEKTRKEIIELGFPDDGYNYLLHLREIRNAGGGGGGSAFYHNPKSRLDQLHSDVRAYDASRVRVSEVRSEEGNGNDDDDGLIYSVAEKTVNVKVQKVVDPEVAALLDGTDLLRFGSDVEEFEDDFVVRANLVEDEREGKEVEEVVADLVDEVVGEVASEDADLVHDDAAVGENTRVRRTLDEQFDLLERQEYGTDDEDEDDDDYGGGYMGEEDEYLDGKLKNPVNDSLLDEKYEVEPDIIQRVHEYTKKYENEDENEEVVIVEESSDESEKWDCETIVTTYSNLDNHPGRIGVPEAARKKKPAETIYGAMNSSSHVISLRGKDKIPVDFLPNRRSSATEKVKVESASKIEQHRRKQHGQETKEEKKERKAAVKEERREARRVKKEMKEIYKCETQRAQRLAAIAAPSSIRLV